MPNTITPDTLCDLLRPGMNVFVAAASGEPTSLLAALLARPEACAGVHFFSCGLPGLNIIDFASLHDEARLTTLFPISKAAQDRQRLMPLSYSGMDAYLRRHRFDLALIQLTPPDAAGRCSLGASVHFVPAAIEHAAIIVAEINHGMPRPIGSVEIDERRLDHVIETDRPLITQERPVPSPAAKVIGTRIAALIEDGDCLQIGIGKIPAAVLGSLKSHRRLRLQGGIINDDVMALHEAGAFDPLQPLVATTVIGSDTLYRWIDGRDDIQLQPVARSHDVRALAAIDRFIAINGVLAVDLQGEANAETVEGRRVSAAGGLVDFVQGACLAKGGRSIVALPARAGADGPSRIVARFGPQDAVSIGKCQADIVVTEHGAASLRGKSLGERAKALIAIASPDLRQTLGRS